MQNESIWEQLQEAKTHLDTHLKAFHKQQVFAVTLNVQFLALVYIFAVVHCFGMMQCYFPLLKTSNKIFQGVGRGAGHIHDI